MTAPHDTAVWRDALSSVGIVSAIPLLCLFVISRETWIKAVSGHLTSLAVGALLANSLVELIPEAFARLGHGIAVPAYVLLGFAGFAVFEWALGSHLHRLGTSADSGVRPYVPLILIGDTLHNAIDGMIIAASFAAGAALGVTTTVAVILHEIPHELGDFGVFVHGGVSPGRAVLLNFVSALAAVAGTVVTLAIGLRNPGVAAALLPVAAGNLIYVATVDLIPALYRELTRRQFMGTVVIMIVGGVLASLPVLL